MIPTSDTEIRRPNREKIQYFSAAEQFLENDHQSYCMGNPYCNRMQTVSLGEDLFECFSSQVANPNIQNFL